MNVRYLEFFVVPRRRAAPKAGAQALLREAEDSGRLCGHQCCSRDLFAFAVQGPAAAMYFCHAWPGMCMIYGFFLTQGFIIKKLCDQRGPVMKGLPF